MDIRRFLSAIFIMVVLEGVTITVGSAGQAEVPPFLWPLSGSPAPDVINSPFGPRTRRTGTMYQFHEGIDLAAPIGTPVFAAASGTVQRLTDDRGCRIEIANDTAPPGCTPIFPNGGRIVALAHGNELYTLYFHLSRQADGLVTGASVLSGAVIGDVGMTGNASYPHLHFEVREESFSREFAQNPLGYLPRVHDEAPAITGLSLTSVGDGTGDVAVVVETAPDDVDLNEVRLLTRDSEGRIVDERRVRFNKRENINPDLMQPEVFFPDGSSLRLAPDDFDSSSSVYRLTVSFKGFSVRPGGSYEAFTREVSRLEDRRVLAID